MSMTRTRDGSSTTELLEQEQTFRAGRVGVGGIDRAVIAVTLVIRPLWRRLRGATSSTHNLCL